MKGNKAKEVNTIVDIKVVTWGKDSHGLFDYESKSLNQNRFVLDSTTSFFRDPTSSEVEIKTAEDLKSMKGSPLFSQFPLAEIVKKDGPANEARYYFKAEPGKQANSMEIEQTSESPYLIVRSLKNKDGNQKGYPLQIGDVIKLGRIEYVVSELKTSEQTLSNRKADTDSHKVYELQGNLVGLCKICLGEEDCQENFFVSPCSCKGSCSIVHINCLKKWIESKMVMKQNDIAISYNFMKFQCEICKDPYPKIIKKNDVGHQLFVLKRPNTPYVMLQGLQQETKENKTMYVISATKPGETIKLGRGHQCQIRITDISVSRQHAYIRYDTQTQRFCIFDNNSKFGTLIGLKQDLMIKGEKLAVQIGRTVITCALKSEDVKEKITRNTNSHSGQAIGFKK